MLTPLLLKRCAFVGSPGVSPSFCVEPETQNGAGASSFTPSQLLRILTLVPPTSLTEMCSAFFTGNRKGSSWTGGMEQKCGCPPVCPHLPRRKSQVGIGSEHHTTYAVEEGKRRGTERTRNAKFTDFLLL